MYQRVANGGPQPVETGVFRVFDTVGERSTIWDVTRSHPLPQSLFPIDSLGSPFEAIVERCPDHYGKKLGIFLCRWWEVSPMHWKETSLGI